MIILSLILLVTNCFALNTPSVILPPLPTSHIDSKSYEHLLNESEKKCPDTQCRLWHQYVRAKFLKNCDLFTHLAEEKDFPLYPFVLIKKSEACTSKEGAADVLTEILRYIKKDKPKYWVEQNLNEGALGAGINSLPLNLVDIVLSFSKTAKNRKLRVTGLQRAVLAAKNNGLSNYQDLLNEFYKAAPRYDLKSEDLVAVGQDAFANHDYDLAIKTYQKVLKTKNLSRPLKRQILENLKTSFKANQRKDEALKIAKKIWLYDPTVSSGLNYARFVWTNHRDKEALAILGEVEKKLKDKSSLAELYFVRARIFEEQRKVDLALLNFSKAAELSKDASQKSLFIWNLAWFNYKIKNFKATKVLLEESSKIETDPGKRAQELFWLAKSENQLGNFTDAKKIFEQLTQEDPIGYYSLLSYRELKKEMPNPSQLPGDGLFSKSPKRLPANYSFIDWTIFDWLISVGELEWARDFLDNEAPMPQEAIPNNWEELFAKYAQASYYVPIFTRIPKLSTAEKNLLYSSHGNLIFPVKWSEFVDQGSHRSGLWPEYIFSIIRQESSFDPLAVSGANAYGLMQLLPSVAKQLGKELKQKINSNDDLLDPQNNILLGSKHLRKYWDIFDGQFILTTASYNASVESVKNWLKSRPNKDPLVFIEDIPYEETRVYVKLVLRNFISYQRMTSPGHSLAFPEWCLQGIQVSKQ